MMYNELAHHGIKGMRWGVRRTEKQLAKLRKKADKENWSEDARLASQLNKKSVKQLTNQELRKLNERIQLEQTYAQLTQKTKSSGQKFVTDFLKEAGKDVAKSYTTKYAKKGIDAAINAAVKKAKKKD